MKKILVYKKYNYEKNYGSVFRFAANFLREKYYALFCTRLVNTDRRRKKIRNAPVNLYFQRDSSKIQIKM